MPEAIAQLRSMRKTESNEIEICPSTSDPLNLIGSVLSGNRISNISGSRVLYRDGKPIAAVSGGGVQYLIEMSPGDQLHPRPLAQNGSPEIEAEAHFGREARAIRLLEQWNSGMC